MRSFFIQSCWNREGLQNIGFVYLILPFLRRIYAGDPAALRRAADRHIDHFVTNPYMVNIIAALIIDQEKAAAAAERDPQAEVAHLKRFLSGPLAAIGDNVIWGCWRPFASLVGSLFLFVGQLSAVSVAVAVFAYLAVFNGVTLCVRVWTAALAWRQTAGALDRILKLPIARATGILCAAGAGLCAFLVVWTIGSAYATGAERLLAGLCAVIFACLKAARVSTRTIFFIGMGASVLCAGLGYIP